MERATKQRLVGGIVLLLGAAVLLPIVLDGSGVPLTVPPMPEPPKVATVEAISPKLDAAVAAANQSVDASHEPAGAEEPVISTEEGEVAPDAAAAAVESPAVATIAPAVTAPTAAKPVVKADDQAKKLAEKIAADKALQAKAAQEKLAQEKAKQEKLAQEKAKQQAAAEKMAAEKAAQEKAAHAKAAASKAEKPSADLPSAWVVQVASLSSRDKADELVKKLRQKGYRATVQSQGSAWRVWVGPELRREVAESIKAKLAADGELKLSGWIQAYHP